jgi:hypothetical protein
MLGQSRLQARSNPALDAFQVHTQALSSPS